MRYAMETHGVTAVRMAPAPTDAELRPRSSIFSNEAGAFIVKWIPYVLVALVYAATSYVRWKKVRPAAADRGCGRLLGVRPPALCSPAPAACPPRAVKLQRAPASMPEAPCIPAVPTSAPRAMRRTESSCSARRRRM